MFYLHRHENKKNELGIRNISLLLAVLFHTTLQTNAKIIMPRILFTLWKPLLTALILMAVHSAHAQENSKPAQMPDWVLYKQDGTLVKSSDYTGKPLILHFWATWCPYCKRLQPGLDAIQKKYSEKGLHVLAVSLKEESGAKPQSELESRGLSLQTLVNGESLGIDQLNIDGTPTTLFIGPDGKILGSTMQSDPQDPKWEAVANYLIGLQDKKSD